MLLSVSGIYKTNGFDIFFAVLTLLCWVFVVGIGIMWVCGKASASLRASYDGVMDLLEGKTLWLAFAIALVATLGSLYYSELRNADPCFLCWLQRICIYPLAVILFVAALRDDRAVRIYVWPLNAIGAVISIYHILIELNILKESGACDPRVPCNLIWIKAFGFITIPIMALTVSVTIAVALMVSRLRNAAEEAGDQARSQDA